MKKIFLLFTLYLFFGVQSIFGQVPKTLSYQGVLTDTLNIKVPDGDYNLTFNFYDVATGGTAIWTEVQTVSIKNGIFDVLLGKVTPLNLAFDIPYWLGIKVGTSAEMTPRIELASAAYSLSYPAGQDGWVDDGSVVRLTDNTDAVGIGTATPASKLHVESIGLNAGYFTSNFIGIQGVVNPTGSGNYFGIRGFALGGTGDNSGLYGEALNGNRNWGVRGYASGSGTQYGIYGSAFGSGTNYGIYGLSSPVANSWAGYFSGDVNVTNALETYRYKMPRGATNGYVLTCDATGESNWQPTEGIASQRNSNGYYLNTSAMRDLETVSITIPAAGYVVLYGQCIADLSNTTGLNYAVIQIDLNAGGSWIRPYYQIAGFENYSSTNNHYIPVFVTRTYYLSSAGSYTFRLEGLQYGSSGTARTYLHILSAIYYPKSYGSVSDIVKDPAGHPEAIPVSVENPEGFEESGSYYEIDLRYYEMKAAQERAEAELAERKLYEAKLRKLQNELELKMKENKQN